MENDIKTFIKSLAYQTLLKRPERHKYLTYEDQMASIKKSIMEMGENLEIVRRRDIFRLVMRELNGLIEKIK